MAGFIIHKSNDYKILLDETLIDIFIDELSPFAKFFDVTFSIEDGFCPWSYNA
jgi:hypothetical protein